MEPLEVGAPQRVGGFTLLGVLGEGGMGRVYFGRSPAGRAVALKLVHPHLARQATFRRRFRIEIEAAQVVSGAFTAPVVAAGPDDDVPWLATAYVPGPSLHEAVETAGPLPEASVWPLAAGLAEALQAVHAAKLVHRDLKPANVLLAADGPRVIDFGIALALEGTSAAVTGTVAGTPAFMSPEHVEGTELTPGSDVFSLGVTIAFAATGASPFGEKPVTAILRRIVASEPHLDGLDGPVHDIVRACLAKDPAQRPSLSHLIEVATTHWSPARHPVDISPWPPDVTALIRAHITPTADLMAAATKPLTDPPAAPGDESTRRHQNTPEAPPTDDPRDPAPRSQHATEDDDSSREADHPHTVADRYDHALRIGDAGDHAEAARLMERVAADQARTLGAEHPDTLHSRRKNALFLYEAGDAAEAARLMERVAADQARTLGADHTDTLTSRYIHAVAVHVSDYAQAARLMARVAADQARVLGADHTDTLESRRKHAIYIRRAGDIVEGARLMERVACDEARILGPDHPKTLDSRNIHATYIHGSGDRAKAARLSGQVAADRARVLGADHTDTLLSRSIHAAFIDDTGDHAEAARLMEHVATDDARVLGDDHPDTLHSRHQHALIVGKTGNHAEAARLMERVAADRERVLGTDHRDTLLSRLEHASCSLETAATFTQAVASLFKVVWLCTRLYLRHLRLRWQTS